MENKEIEEKEKTPKRKRKFNAWLFAFVVSVVLLAVSVSFNIISLLGISNQSCDMFITTVSDTNTEIKDNELLLGENYVCNISITNKNNSYIDKMSDVKIIIKKANIILEKGNFNNIEYEDFSYNDKQKYVEAEINVLVDGFKIKKDVISFNFCPTQLGDSCMKIEVYLGGELIKVCEYSIKL